MKLGPVPSFNRFYFGRLTFQRIHLLLYCNDCVFLTDYKPPSKFALELVMEYDNLVCNGIDVAKDNMVYQQVSNAVSSSVNSIKCVKDKACSVKQSKVCKLQEDIESNEQ